MIVGRIVQGASQRRQAESNALAFKLYAFVELHRGEYREVRDLADGRGALVDGGCDLVVADIEGLA